jgi:DNA polymerase-3 subunit gamma/tau
VESPKEPVAETKPPAKKVAEDPSAAISTRVPEPTASAAEPSARPVAADVAPAEFWRAFLDSVRRDRKLISAWVESGALLGIEGGTLTLGFPPQQSFAKDFLEQGHLDFLADKACEILGRKMKVRLETRDGLVIAPPAPPPAPRDPMEAFKDDPLIRKALEIFRGEIKSD